MASISLAFFSSRTAARALASSNRPASNITCVALSCASRLSGSASAARMYSGNAACKLAMRSCASASFSRASPNLGSILTALAYSTTANSSRFSAAYWFPRSRCRSFCVSGLLQDDSSSDPSSNAATPRIRSRIGGACNLSRAMPIAYQLEEAATRPKVREAGERIRSKRKILRRRSGRIYDFNGRTAMRSRSTRMSSRCSIRGFKRSASFNSLSALPRSPNAAETTAAWQRSLGRARLELDRVGENLCGDGVVAQTGARSMPTCRARWRCEGRATRPASPAATPLPARCDARPAHTRDC